jgi:hypothetical protein
MHRVNFPSRIVLSCEPNLKFGEIRLSNADGENINIIIDDKRSEDITESLPIQESTEKLH